MNIIPGKEGELIIKFILRVYAIGKFPLIKVIGHPGTGKSGACIRIAELLNKRIHKEEKFDPKYIVDSLEKLLKVVMESKSEDRRVIIIEEMSTLFNNRRFMQSENITANSLFDTMRKKKMIVIGNYPISKTVDSHIEKAFNCEIEVLRLDKANKQYFCKAKKLQTNPGSGKTYTHLFTDDKGYDVHYFCFKWCDVKTFEEYDEGKDKFMNDLYESMLLKNRKKQLEFAKLKQEVEVGESGILPPLTAKQTKVLEALHQGKTTTQIAAEGIVKHGVEVSQCVHAMRRKGYQIERYGARDARYGKYTDKYDSQYDDKFLITPATSLDQNTDE